MAKFTIVDDGELSNVQYNTIEEATNEAETKVRDTPDSEIEVVQILKIVSSKLQIDIKDVE